MEEDDSSSGNESSSSGSSNSNEGSSADNADKVTSENSFSSSGKGEKVKEDDYEGQKGEDFKKEVELSNPDVNIQWRRTQEELDSGKSGYHEHASDPGQFGFTADATDKNTDGRYVSHVDPETRDKPSDEEINYAVEFLKSLKEDESGNQEETRTGERNFASEYLNANKIVPDLVEPKPLGENLDSVREQTKKTSEIDDEEDEDEDSQKG